VFLISTSALKPEKDLGAARDVIRDLVSGQSNFISGIWPSNALKNIWATLLIMTDWFVSKCSAAEPPE
jgi:hypothetical protein